MKKLLLFGVGSPLVVEVEETCHRLGLEILAFVRNREGDDHCSDRTRVVSASEVPHDFVKCLFLCPIFTPENRRIGVSEALALGLAPSPGVVDPTCVLPRRYTVGAGSYINAATTLGAEVQIGSFVVINRSVSLGHHAVLQDYVSVGPGAVAAGEAHIEAGALIGTGAVILPRVRIGAGAKVGAGAVVVKDVEPGAFVVGNPAQARVRG